MAYLLTCNAGSSSIKLALFETNTLNEVASASVENIGQAQAQFLAGGIATPVMAISHHEALVTVLIPWLNEQSSGQEVTAVGHRVVHGSSFHEPTLIDDASYDRLEQLSYLDPDHMPAILETLKTLRIAFGTVPHVACFDTAFFHDLPLVAKLTTLPRAYYEQGLRRYGFHGLSYQYILDSFSHHEGAAAANGKVIMAHLGSGCSLAALTGGKPQETTMGFTPTSGVPMSTRSGDLDPGILTYLARHDGMNLDEIDEIINHKSGLLGVSDLSADMLTLLQAQAANQYAADAVELFCYQISKAIGGLTTSIGGLNSLIFTGGIGERSAEIRHRICKRLAFLGIQIDSQRNGEHARLISSRESDVGVHVIHTNEAIAIAKATRQLTTQGEN
ncbi:MAG: acetate kinase [Patescibacteria group bacterium]|nr:acetate/propionate family kinase [Candidatus Saccharibacteria bacterium]MDQ5963618.1 acetate kinase [Patescibacteria group bacterium]